MKSTPAMRARIRELMNNEQDDYDRAVECVLDDFEALEAALRKVRSYNVDIAAERINYRPHDHIQVIDTALAPEQEK